MSISTGKGDGGETGLVGGRRVPKDDPRLETYGTVDELNAILGVARCSLTDHPIDVELATISSLLFDLGSDLATPDAGLENGPAPRISNDAVALLTGWIQREESSLPPLRTFILPGGTRAAADLHHARTVCRRAERKVVAHVQQTGEGKTAVVFLNRLSDLLFLYARRANHDAGVDDVAWTST